MSTLKLANLSNQAGSSSVPIADVINGSAKAWVNFNGVGTVAIRASYNVSSITDNGTGNYTVNFTNAMLNTNFAVSVTGTGVPGTNISTSSISAYTTSSCSIAFGTCNNSGATNTSTDQTFANLIVMSS